jgi:hypothetical protein
MSAKRPGQVIYIADPIAEVVAETASGWVGIKISTAVLAHVLQDPGSGQYAALVSLVTTSNLIDEAIGICRTGPPVPPKARLLPALSLRRRFAARARRILQ